MPTLTIVSICITKVTFPPNHMIWFCYADGSIQDINQAGMKDMEEVAKNLSKSEWEALGDAYRNIGEWVRV